MAERLKVKVAVYMILIRDYKVLFSRRQNTGWSDGKLSLPSGHVDPEELPSHAAVRELEEEVGIKVTTSDISIKHITYTQDQYVDFYFVVKNWQGEPQNLELEKCAELVWVDVANPNDQFAPSVLESVQQALNGEFYSEFVER